jgi:hypothetical protein
MVTEFNHGHPWSNRFDLDRPLAIEKWSLPSTDDQIIFCRKQNFPTTKKGCAEKDPIIMCRWFLEISGMSK